MKRNTRLLSLIACAIFFLNACIKDTATKRFIMQVPVYKLKTDVIASIKSIAPQPIENMGKIYLKGDHIFIAEKNKGIHVINKSNAGMLTKEFFINMPGSEDIAIINNTLYSDCATDLLVLDITQLDNIKLIKNIPNVFPDKKYINGYYLDSNMVLVEYRKVDTTMVLDDYEVYSSLHNMSGLKFENQYSAASSPGATGATGTGGSMARFTIAYNHLYTVSTTTLTAFNIADNHNPILTSSKNIGWEIETVFPFQQNLFIGSQNGMFIYNISNPSVPVSSGNFQHARVCDPVIADGNYAYVTLRNGTQCQGFLNELDIIDITNLKSPVLKYKIDFTNPHGLAKDGNVMIICDGNSGIKVLDATDPLHITTVKHVALSNTYDVIMSNGTAYIITDKELHVYYYTQNFDFTLTGKISK